MQTSADSSSGARTSPGSCPHSAVFLTQAGANIVTLGQHSTAAEGGAFFQRTEFHLPGLPAGRDELARSFAGLAQQIAALQIGLIGAPQTVSTAGPLPAITTDIARRSKAS
jgi:formyltetrahydrofolate hydrolase